MGSGSSMKIWETVNMGSGSSMKIWGDGGYGRRF